MVWRSGLVLSALLAGFGLSGCITGGSALQSAATEAPMPSQAILDGTIRHPADWDDAPPAPRRLVRARPRVTVGEVAAIAAPDAVSDASNIEITPENDRLRNTMTICRGC